MPLPVYLLALAVFAMGTSEFMLAGLLPDLAADLDVAVGTAGLLTTAFAVGMAVGAPLVAALARRRPPRSTLLVFLGLFLVAHVVGAITTSFAVLFTTRIVAAFANAGFLAVALTATVAMVAPDRKGRALSILLGGTTIAVVAGVPGGALLGALLGWRATFWAVALLSLPAALGVLRGLPPTGETDGAPLRTELNVLRRSRLVLVMGLGALVNAATFGAFTYIAPVVTETAGLGDLWIPVVLVLFGAGSFAGVTAAGRLSDRRPGRAVAVAGPLLLLGWCALALWAAHPAVLLPLAFTQGALAFAVGSTLIARVLHEGADAPTMAGAYATAALNVGAAAGPVLAGIALATGDTGPLWAAAVLVAAALGLAAPGRRVLTGTAAR
ncbi:MFS transporter [Glycomyces luteolus]|uniref:MFS transporter n=1 Tax=Glycomyces luteolus TaxID=2670330 RepID=A0A9X3PPF1_9ACTN|nr:Cmx/CmrA family chloramphenicol efflux MFS transporter [Glycomyces luteolus]MDA1362660.1 MFS transporter [Glycomyces luteolus]